MGVVRLLLAISVVFAHAEGVFAYKIAGGRASVESFFVISGFLIQMVLATKYTGPGARWAFWSNRFLRLYPSYVAAILSAAVIGGLVFAITHKGYLDQLGRNIELYSFRDRLFLAVTTVTIIGQDFFNYLVPSLTDGLVFSKKALHSEVLSVLPIQPAWSISVELMFYFIAPILAVLSNKMLTAVVVASFGARVIGFYFGYDEDPWTYRFFPFELMFFVAGMLSYRLRDYLRPLFEGHQSTALVVMIAIILVGHPLTIALRSFSYSAELIAALFTVGLVVTLPTLFASSRRFKYDRFLGDLSYPMYLFHWQIILAYRTLFSNGHDWRNATLRTVVCLILSIGLSIVAVHLIERPIDRFRQRRAKKYESISAVGQLEMAPTGVAD